jgi:nucleotide-binding universal stress UspA family protein
MASTILVPLDGSSLSRHALPYASFLAQAMNARLVLFHAYRAKTDDVETDPELDLVREQADLANGLRQRGVNATTWLSYDEPGAAIVTAAADLRADLIVMSTHGRGGVSQLMYGSVADHVVRSSGVPILLVTANARPRWTDNCRLSVLVPLDGSAFAETALGPASELARLLGAKIVLLRIPSPDVGWKAPWQSRHRRGSQGVLEEAERYLEHLSAGPRVAGHDVEMRVEIGPADQVIAGVADELSPTLVLMTTHGRGVVSRFAVESVAADVLRNVAAPVLLLRPQYTREDRDVPHAHVERSVV